MTGPDQLETVQADLGRRVWHAVTGGSESDDRDLDRLALTGPVQVLPSVFDVTGLAATAVGAATLAAAQLLAMRTGQAQRAVTVERRAASAAFLSEVLFTPEGWVRPPVWDAIAGNYEAADGWIRLHTNYRSHRIAAASVLGDGSDRAAVSAAVRRWSAGDLETAIVAAGGCAAAMHDRQTWLATPPGMAAATEPLVARADRPCATPADLTYLPPESLPFDGVRVLDLTRVIAGPVCTRFLAAYGADVLRIDPPGFEEVAALVPETTSGKHCAALDLTERADRDIFEALVSSAHVLVTGLRPGALDGLGYDHNRLSTFNPNLIVASLDAYGWNGPWSGRRGFDSLVQMSCGIAAAGAAARDGDEPAPLPAQALDHATGYLLAAAVGHALKLALLQDRASDIRCSLIATATLLCDYPNPTGLDLPTPEWSAADTEPTTTDWGPARRVPTPGSIDNVSSLLQLPAGPLGRHRPQWIIPRK